MKTLIKILSLFFILVHFNIGFGQDIPWRYRITGANHTIIIDEKTTINISDYSGSGVLGVFYDSLGIDICAGYVDLAQDANYLIVYGESENTIGITAGDKFRFKLWDREQDCIYDDVAVAYATSDQITNTDVFVNDGVSNITSIKASSIVVEYPVSVICPNEKILSAIIDSGRYSYTFSSVKGLTIDENTGIIDATSSETGDYIIKVSSELCISNPTHQIRISYSDLSLPEQLFKCPNELLDVTSIATQATDSWTITDSLSSSKELEAGEYFLSFKNTDGCVIEHQINVVNYPEQELQLETEYNCESTTILLSTDQNIENVEWPNDATGKSMEVYENSEVEIQYIDSNNCNRAKSVNVEVKKLKIQTLETTVRSADCYLKGSIEISNLNIENRIGNVHYEFINQLTNETFLSSDQLTEGKYQIIISDDRNCSDTWAQELTVLKDCLKDRPVFSPNNDYVDDTYYISDTGFAEVYNRNGTKVCEFETPIYWDGTNLQGKKLPMGTYLIVINKKKVTNITILR